MDDPLIPQAMGQKSVWLVRFAAFCMAGFITATVILAVIKGTEEFQAGYIPLGISIVLVTVSTVFMLKWNQSGISNVEDSRFQYITILQVVGVITMCSSAIAVMEAGEAAPTFTIGGAASASGLTLHLNGGESAAFRTNVNIPANTCGTFSFAARLEQGSRYTVEVPPDGQPATASCTVQRGTGTVSDDVNNIGITCTPSWGISGGASGAISQENPLILSNTIAGRAEQIEVFSSGGDAIRFMDRVPDGGSIDVRIVQPPQGQTCTGATARSDIRADVTDINIVCS